VFSYFVPLFKLKQSFVLKQFEIFCQISLGKAIFNSTNI